jgi:predicted ATPase
VNANSAKEFQAPSTYRPESRGLLAPVCDRFTEGFDTQHLKEAKALLDELG